MAMSMSLRLAAMLAAMCGPQLVVSEAVEAAAAAELPVGEVAGLPTTSGAVGEVESEAQAETPQPDASTEEVGANATEQAKLDLAGLEASAASSGWWGHGIFGETCCMCSKHFGRTTILYAAEDYSHLFGGHNAFWRCQHQCEYKCRSRGGHLFGCYDEQHLQAMDRRYGHRANYQILHDGHFGNIC
jgi:hypothetical protein